MATMVRDEYIARWSKLIGFDLPAVNEESKLTYKQLNDILNLELHELADKLERLGIQPWSK